MSAKLKLLLATYMEYQKDLPQFNNVVPEKLGMSEEVFREALEKLIREGYLYGDKGKQRFVTAKAIEDIEQEFDIKHFISGKVKTEIIINKICDRESRTVLEKYKIS